MRMRRGLLVAGIMVIGLAIANPGQVLARPPAPGSGHVTMAWDLRLVTDLLQDQVAVYAQAPGMAAVSLDDPDDAGFAWDLPVYRSTKGKAKTMGGILLINQPRQTVVNLSLLTLHRVSRTVSGISAFSSSGYQGRIDLFRYSGGTRGGGDLRGVQVRLAPGVAAKLNGALDTNLFREGMRLGTMDLVLAP